MDFIKNMVSTLKQVYVRRIHRSFYDIFQGIYQLILTKLPFDNLYMSYSTTNTQTVNPFFFDNLTSLL